MICYLNPWLVTGDAVITSIRNMSKKVNGKKGLVWPNLVQAASDERAAPTDRIFELDFQKSLRVLNFFELVVEFSVKLNVIFPMTIFGVLYFYQEARLKRYAHFKNLPIFWFTQRRVCDKTILLLRDRLTMV